MDYDEEIEDYDTLMTLMLLHVFFRLILTFIWTTGKPYIEHNNTKFNYFWVALCAGQDSIFPTTKFSESSAGWHDISCRGILRLGSQTALKFSAPHLFKQFKASKRYHSHIERCDCLWTILVGTAAPCCCSTGPTSQEGCKEGANMGGDCAVKHVWVSPLKVRVSHTYCSNLEYMDPTLHWYFFWAQLFLTVEFHERRTCEQLT